MTSTMTPELTGMHIRMPPQLLDDLRETAEGNDRTIAAEVRRALREHIARVRQEAAA